MHLLVKVSLSIALTLMGACSDPVKAVTDAEITQLLSDGADSPKIALATLECVQLLAGVEIAPFEDLPIELKAALKLDCTRVIGDRLKNPKQNAPGLTMEDVSRPEFAERALNLSNQLEDAAIASYKIQAAANKKAAEEKDVAARAAAEKDFQDQKAAYLREADTYPAKIAEMQRLCGVWRDLYRQLPKGNKKDHYWNPTFCRSGELADMAKNAEQDVRAAIASGEVRGNDGHYEPHFYIETSYNPDRMNDLLDRARTGVAEMRSMLGLPANN